MANYILEGKEPKEIHDILQWGKWFEENTKDRIVGKTDITDDIKVSTVFLGIDHNYGDGPPLLFETMVFGGEDDQELFRYSTWDEAEKGHQMAVEVQKKSIKLLK